MNRHDHAPTVGLIGDAKLALGGLRDLLHGIGPRPSRRGDLRARKAVAADMLRNFQPNDSAAVAAA